MKSRTTLLRQIEILKSKLHQNSYNIKNVEISIQQVNAELEQVTKELHEFDKDILVSKTQSSNPKSAIIKEQLDASIYTLIDNIVENNQGTSILKPVSAQVLLRVNDSQLNVTIARFLNPHGLAIVTHSAQYPSNTTIGEIVDDCSKLWGVSRRHSFLEIENATIPNDVIILNCLDNTLTNTDVHFNFKTFGNNKRDWQDATQHSNSHSSIDPIEITKEEGTITSLSNDGNNPGSRAVFQKRRDNNETMEPKVVFRKVHDCLIYFVMLITFFLAYVSSVNEVHSFLVYEGITTILDTSFSSMPLAQEFVELYNVSERFSTKLITFQDISSDFDFWSWTELLAVLLFASGETTSSELMLGVNEIVGPVRFRQLRVRPNVGCDPVDDEEASNMIGINPNCYSPFQSEYGSSDTFGLRFNKGFLWKSDDILYQDGGNGKYSGLLANYDSSGFVLDIPTNGSRTDFLDQLFHLESNTWIDIQTSAILTEFNVYNYNLNTYAGLQLAFEQDQSGLLTVSHLFKPIHDATCSGCVQNAPTSFVLALVIWMTLVKLSKTIDYFTFKETVIYYSSWDILDWVILLSYYSFVIVLMHPGLSGGRMFEEAWLNTENFVSVTRSGFTKYIANLLGGVFLFACLLRMIWFLRQFYFGHRLYSLYLHAFKVMGILLCFFSVIALSYTLMVYWVFGPVTFSVLTFERAFLRVVYLLAGTRLTFDDNVSLQTTVNGISFLLEGTTIIFNSIITIAITIHFVVKKRKVKGDAEARQKRTNTMYYNALMHIRQSLFGVKNENQILSA